MKQEGAAVEGPLAIYGAVLAVEYVRAVLGLSRSFCSSAKGQKLVRRTDKRTLPTGVAVATKSPDARQQGILTPPAKYQVDRTTGGEVMGIFRQQRNKPP